MCSLCAAVMTFDVLLGFGYFYMSVFAVGSNVIEMTFFQAAVYDFGFCMSSLVHRCSLFHSIV